MTPYSYFADLTWNNLDIYIVIPMNFVECQAYATKEKEWKHSEL